MAKLYVRSYLYQGQKNVEEAFEIVYETRSGRRYAHNQSYRGGLQAKTEAERTLERMARYIQNAGIISLEHWHEVEPAYGSLAFQREVGA